MIQAKTVLLLSLLAAGLASLAGPSAAQGSGSPTPCLGGNACGGCQIDTLNLGPYLAPTMPPDVLPDFVDEIGWSEDLVVPKFERFDLQGNDRELKQVQIGGRIILGNGADGVGNHPAFVQWVNNSVNNSCPISPADTWQYSYRQILAFPASSPLIDIDVPIGQSFSPAVDPNPPVTSLAPGASVSFLFDGEIPIPDAYYCDTAVLDAFTYDSLGPPSSTTITGHAATMAFLQSQQSGCPWLDVNHKLHAGVELTVSYRYCPSRPPECLPTQTMYVCDGDTTRIPVSSVIADPEDMLDCSTVEVVPGSGPAFGTVRIESGCATPGSCPSCTSMGDCSDCYIVYTHNGGPQTSDSFEIRAFDNQGCGLPLPNGMGCLVQVEISNPPGFSNQGPIELCEDDPPYQFNPLDALNDVNEADCSTLTLVSPAGPRLSQVMNGGANCANHLWEYDPVGFVGTELFDFEVRTPDLPNGDPGCVSRFRWRFTVNGRPTGSPPLFDGCAGLAIDVFPFQGAFDPESMLDCSGILIESLPTRGVLQGAVVGQYLPVTCPNPPGDCSACSVTYIPNVGEVGSDSFTYRIRDAFGCLSDPIVASLLLRPAPVIPPQVFETCKNEPADFDVLSAATHPADRDLDCATFLPAAIPTANGGSVVGVNCSGQGSCTGCVARYTPPTDFTGFDSFFVTVTDVWGCASMPVEIEVFVSEFPNARNDVLCGCPDTPIEIDVLANDDDPDGFLDACSLMLDGGPTIVGSSAVLIGDCTAGPEPMKGDCDDCRFLYTPASGYAGPDDFFYTVRDDTGCESRARVRIDIQERPLVTPPQDLYVCVGGTDMCDPMMPLMFPLLGDVVGDVDPSSILWEGLTYGTLDVDPNTGMAVYTPNGNDCNVVETFTYTVESTEACRCRSLPAQVSIELRCAPIARDDIGLVDPLAPTDPIQIHVLENDSAPFSTLLCTSVQICDPPSDAGATAIIVGCDNDADCSGCLVEYTPPPDWDGEDSFTYRVSNAENPACWDTATVILRFSNDCEGVNRRMPGALLLFPEFDQREGSMTMFTITNVAMEGMGDVDVEIVYRSRDDCAEFNRTFTMTPGDTRTFLTYVDNPHPGQGFAYAFAKCPQTGEPIAYNELIGQSMVFDGLRSTSYAVNACVFKGIGTDPSVGCPNYNDTDVNGDGVRDLDGIEYQEVPDQLIVPRFLGQTETLESELVILSMTGGADFDTTISLLIFNDNEELFEDTHTFRCWDKVGLESISGVTRNDFLSTLNSNDLNEIFGARDHESGWILIDGLFAVSTATTFEDPAVYGFLVECVPGMRCVADLPWELCLQDNGSLYPSGVDGTGGQ